ncbi:DUF4153 domain-containing protein [Micromonospora sp. BQ11]|uniref:DUF4153 domain-containing protein n=1 Tax=Micromonospora sp. BQ11 TaxID=3452212 RepID=UPI003F8AEA8C
MTAPNPAEQPDPSGPETPTATPATPGASAAAGPSAAARTAVEVGPAAPVAVVAPPPPPPAYAGTGGPGRPVPPPVRPQSWPPAAPPPPLFGGRWPGPVDAPRPLFLGALAAGAVVAASAVPPADPGLGWTIAALACTGALTTVAAVRSAPGSTVRPGATGAPGRTARPAWALATIALVSVGTVRSAGWLFVLCLLAAAATATLAVTGGRTPLGMLTATVLPPVAAFRALPWAARGLADRRAGAGGGGGVGRTLASVAVSLGLLVLFGLLFSSADAVFAGLVANLLPEISPPGVVAWAFRLLVVGAGLLGGAYLLARPPDLDGLRAAPARPVRRLEWVLPLALLDALFAAFVLVQITVLFGGSRHVLGTAGPTYAQYARSGFWQLLAVSALTLLVIGGAVRWAPRDRTADRVLIRVLLGALTLLSLVIVASALYRMDVYADAYGATRLRLVVATVEIWLGLLFVLVGVAVLRLRAGWLPRLVLGTAVLALLGLAVVNPDHLIAERNVDRFRETGRVDVDYVAGLSADAVPALDRLPEPLRSCALREIVWELPDDGVRTWNLGRARARALLAAEPPREDVVTCPYPLW